MAASDLNLRQTLFCGQCFRWEENPDGVFSGIAFGKKCVIRQEENKSLTDDPIWRTYFDLDTDYGFLQKRLSGISPILSEAVQYAPGIRILRQDFWEALASFIISQNNNIPRIRGIIARLCENFGEKFNDGYAFPEPQKLLGLLPEDLSSLRCGFRARYLLDAAQKVCAGEIDPISLRKMPLEKAKAQLMTICGVGPKVADCVLLYGLHRMEAFPMDVWMKRAMKTLFPGMKPEDFGEGAGLAQQYIFYYSRQHPELFLEKNSLKLSDSKKFCSGRKL